jgi:membrane-associated phospholipid phosphatase
MILVLSLSATLNWISYGTAAYNPVASLVHDHSKCNIAHLLVAESVGNSITLLMKNTINSPRPNNSGNDGMPSGHSMNSAIGINSGFGLAMSVTTAELRLKSHYHTPKQVMVGLAIGFLANQLKPTCRP